jgi:hypothetical protein
MWPLSIVATARKDKSHPCKLANISAMGFLAISG